MNDEEQDGNGKVVVARVLLALDLALCLAVCVLGVKNVLDPPTTLCGRADPSIPNAALVAAVALPPITLGILLLRRPTRTRSRTVMAVIAIVLLTLLAMVIPAGFAFQNGFCIAPF